MKLLGISLAGAFFLLNGGLYFLSAAIIGHYIKVQPKSLILSYCVSILLFLLSFYTREHGVFGFIHLRAHDGFSLGDSNTLLLNSIWGVIWTLAGNSFGQGAQVKDRAK